MINKTCACPSHIQWRKWQKWDYCKVTKIIQVFLLMLSISILKSWDQSLVCAVFSWWVNKASLKIFEAHLPSTNHSKLCALLPLINKFSALWTLSQNPNNKWRSLMLCEITVHFCVVQAACQPMISSSLLLAIARINMNKHGILTDTVHFN